MGESSGLVGAEDCLERRVRGDILLLVSSLDMAPVSSASLF